MEILREGSRGPQVELLQAALVQAGFSQLAVDGIFGSRTRRALQEFQSSRGLAADGIAGPATWAALRPFLTGYDIYTVRRGDTFYSIARAYGTTVDAIRTANPNVNPNNLLIGEEITVPLRIPVVFTNISFTYLALEIALDGLMARYPFLRVMSIGNSVMGKRLYCVIIGEGPNRVSYNASHHANEWITTPVLMKFIEEYAAAYASGGSVGGQSASSMYRATTLLVVPMVNPDGVDLVTGALPTDSFYFIEALRLSANYPNLRFPEDWKANIRGVDLNLNYPADWERARELKFAEGFTMPGPREYVGPAPLSEPESNAMVSFTNRYGFSLIMAYHTQGRVIYWKYLDYNPPRSLEIAQEFSRLSGYVLSETPEYSAYAGYKDWFILIYNRPGYTIEAGLGINPLPISQFDEIYAEKVAMLAAGVTITA